SIGTAVLMSRGGFGALTTNARPYREVVYAGQGPASGEPVVRAVQAVAPAVANLDTLGHAAVPPLQALMLPDGGAQRVAQGRGPGAPPARAAAAASAPPRAPTAIAPHDSAGPGFAATGVVAVTPRPLCAADDALGLAVGVSTISGRPASRLDSGKGPSGSAAV